MTVNKRNGAFRKKKFNFAQVSNLVLRDTVLSLKAKGLFGLIQSYITLESFTLYKNFIKSQCKEGEKAFESTWKELKDAGYLIQYRLQDDKTKQFYYEYELLDEQNLELAKEVHSNQNRKKQEEKSHNPKKDGMDKKEEKTKKAIPTKREGMDIAPHGKGGVYTNTDNTNIDNNNTESISTIDSNLRELFESNICSLKKTTSVKFEKYINEYDYNFIKAVILYCIRCKAKSFAYFEKTIKESIKSDKTTAPQFINSVVDYMNEKYKGEDSLVAEENRNIKTNSFNNFKQREYDWDKLEKDLLGWGDNE